MGRRALIFSAVCLSIAAVVTSRSALAKPSRQTSSDRRHHAANDRRTPTHARRTHDGAHSRTRRVLFGERTIKSARDEAPAGLAVAFPFSSRLTGSATSIGVYVASGNRATRLIAGLYSDQHGRPGSLLATGSRSLPNSGAWNLVSARSTSVHTGGNYWIALLGQGGTLFFRDHRGGPCRSAQSSKRNLSSLPASWSTGARSSRCPAWAYVSGVEAPPWNTALPTITGKAVQGTTLSASTGAWGNSPRSFSYQWQDCTAASCANVAGANGASYTLRSSDVGDAVDVVVRARDSGGASSATSRQTGVVTATPVVTLTTVLPPPTVPPPPVVTPAAPVNLSAPTISGLPQVGATVSAATGTWSNNPTSYAYQWQDCKGSSCTNIAGETSSSYTVGVSVGETIDVVVTASNAAGSVSQTSLRTSAVTSAPAPLCSPSPCNDTESAQTFSVTYNDGINNSGQSVTNSYSLYRPKNLVNSPSDPVPLVLEFAFGPTWYTESSTLAGGPYVVIVINPTHANGPQYATPATGVDPIADCGASGTVECDDGNEVQAILNAVECNGAFPCQNINTWQVIASGGSKGGDMAQDLLCDPRLSTRVQGYLVMSNNFFGALSGGAPTMPRCPTEFVQGATTVPTFTAIPNTNLVFMAVDGSADPYEYGYQANGTSYCNYNGTGFVDLGDDCAYYGHMTPDLTKWGFGAQQAATTLFGRLLGCSPIPTSTIVFGNTDQLTERDYGSCVNPLDATSTIDVHGGGHVPNGYDGLDAAKQFANLWHAHRG